MSLAPSADSPRNVGYRTPPAPVSLRTTPRAVRRFGSAAAVLLRSWRPVQAPPLNPLRRAAETDARAAARPAAVLRRTSALSLRSSVPAGAPTGNESASVTSTL